MEVPDFVKIAKKYVTQEDTSTREVEIFRLARKLEIYAAKKGEQQLELNEYQASIMVNDSASLPYSVPEQAVDMIKAELITFSDIKTASDALFVDDAKPKVEQIQPLIKELQKFKVRSALQAEL